MSSLYDELARRLELDPRITKRGGARADLGLLMFNARDAVRELWAAADAEAARAGGEARPGSDRLKSAVEELRPLFGDRG